MATKLFPISDILEFQTKSRRKAGDGLASGKYPFFTSSQIQSKWLDEADYTIEALVLGTGGSPSVHCANNFSTSADVFILAPKTTNVSIKYISYFLRGHTEILERGFKGAGLKHLSRDYVSKISVPLPLDAKGNPDMKEQNRIVALFEEAEDLKKKRAEADDKMTAVIPALFNQMFGGQKWPIVKLGDVATVKIGPFGTQLHSRDYIEGGLPLVNPTHIVNGKIVIDPKLTITEEKAKEISQYIMHTGDIVLGRRGEMGRCAVVTEKENGYLCGTGSLFITPTEKITSVFLGIVLSAPLMKKQLEDSARGVTMKNLNINVVENLKIELPPMKLQMEFVEKVNEIGYLDEKQKRSSQQVNILFQSLLSTIK